MSDTRSDVGGQGTLEKWWDRFAYVFNRAALGAGTLLGGYLLSEGYLLRGLGMFALIPVYFYLKDRYNAP